MALINQDQWCFTFAAGAPRAPGDDRGASPLATLWTTGSVITVSFLDGEPALWKRVQAAANIWTDNLANLHFEFRSDTTATAIRISFAGQGSWSVLGTTCTEITDPSEPTMNFGWLGPGVSDAELTRVVLHEFGHALGLIHEHQNPVGGIQWNEEVIYEELSKPPNSWARDRIADNIFNRYAVNTTNFTAFDPTSIMMYQIPARWTKGGFTTSINATLSKCDKEFIRRNYP